jgi:hypothetical protein
MSDKTDEPKPKPPRKPIKVPRPTRGYREVIARQGWYTRLVVLIALIALIVLLAQITQIANFVAVMVSSVDTHQLEDRAGLLNHQAVCNRLSRDAPPASSP